MSKKECTAGLEVQPTGMFLRRMLCVVAALCVVNALCAASQVAAADRTMTFRNHCGETTWVGALNLPGFTNDAGWELPGACMQDSDCPSTAAAPQTCDTATGSCVLSLDLPDSTQSMTFWPRTRCDFDPTGKCPTPGQNCCATGGCTDAADQWSLTCDSGPQSPVTVAELSLSKTTVDNDFYDVGAIDGVNVGVELKPVAGGSCPAGFTGCKEYWCGNPGSPKPLTSVGPCAWLESLGETCGGQDELRSVAVDTTCTTDADCPGSSTCDPGRGACQCTMDSDCDPGNGVICGMPNNTYPGYKACGAFAGCTTYKAICGLLYAKQTGGAACTIGGECASGICDPMTTKCKASTLDGLATTCNTLHQRTVSCAANEDCPRLVGYKGACPAGSTAETDGKGDPVCRMDCNGASCTLPSCTSDSDCTALEGTFMLCDTQMGSPTFQKCVSTDASLHAASGVNGQSCYASPDGGMNPAPDVTTLCGGCPTDMSNPLSSSWPTTSDTCFENNPDWVSEVQPVIAEIKEACPTAYSFPFDDPSSTFQCRNGSDNSADYEITFCPATDVFSDAFESGDTTAWTEFP